MNSTASLPAIAANITEQSTVTEGISSALKETTSFLISNLTTTITKTQGNNASNYTPGNWSSPSVNATRIPTEDGDDTIKRTVVIVTNIFVVIAIIITCILAVRHRRWESMMRREREKDYDLVDGEDAPVNEDYELFDK